MKEIHVCPGDHVRSVITEALRNAPSFFEFNGVYIEAVETMKGHPDAASFLYSVYDAGLRGITRPVWSVKPPEKPCKQCGKNNFLTDKKCWWCETTNPCQ